MTEATKLEGSLNYTLKYSLLTKTNYTFGLTKKKNLLK